MLRTTWVLTFACVLAVSMQAAFATVRVHVDVSTQTMSVNSDGGGSYSWPVSTGRAGFRTPTGTYRPQRMMAIAFSAKYHNSPMPHSIFFRGGYAIHGTYETGHLGRAASHGCIRLAPSHAATLFSLVRAEGAVISISGSAGRRDGVASRRSRATGFGSYGRPVGSGALAARSQDRDTGYYAYTSQHEPGPVQQWQPGPAEGF